MLNIAFGDDIGYSPQKKIERRLEKEIALMRKSRTLTGVDTQSTISRREEDTTDCEYYNNKIVFDFDSSITLTGVYTKSIITRRGEGTHYGRYKIVVNDCLEVSLLDTYEKESIRPQEEVERFEGKRVTVTGILWGRTYVAEPLIDYPTQFVGIPCFDPIDTIYLAED